MKGWLITFEGTEGSGKTTHARWLAERLRSAGRPCRLVREPGGTAIGEEIRHLFKHSAANAGMTPEAELFLINASRAQLVQEIIRPALQAGEIVISDRYFDSTLAYQGYGRGLDLNQVKATIALATGGTRPDLTFLLHLPLAVSEERRWNRRLKEGPVRDRMEASDRAFFQRVEAGYLAIGEAEPDRVQVLDSMLPIPEIQSAIWSCVEARISHGVLEGIRAQQTQSDQRD